MTEDRVLNVDLAEPERLQIISEALSKTLSSLRHVVWPLIPPARVPTSSQMLVPLSRLGAEQGFSGASVFVAYFTDEGPRYLPSRPLIVKVGSPKSLEEELQNATDWPLAPHGEDARWAKPFFLHKKGELAVLVAPFASAQALNRTGPAWGFKHRDLWGMLRDSAEPVDSILEHLGDLYRLLHSAHRSGAYNCRRAKSSLRKEYYRYLRGLSDKQIEIPSQLFGGKSRIHLFGRWWPNPVKLVRRVLELPAIDMARGPVHGDLHPKNVVLDGRNRAHVIDFGWASSSGHVVRDYVLMELNVRALTLPPHLSMNDLDVLSKVLAPSDRYVNSGSIIGSRLRLIREGIWEPVRLHGIVVDWEREYLVPLFLVAFGLIKYLDGARNQSALIHTVLSLTERLSGVL